MSTTNNLAKPNSLSTVLIVPDGNRRKVLHKELADANLAFVREVDSYPPASELADIARLDCDVMIVDLDSNLEEAIRVIENFAGSNMATIVMAYSSRNDSALIRRSMHAGAREFLIQPLPAEVVREAFGRISSRRPEAKSEQGKLLVFVPSKGGVGVTTIAANFALALTKESGAKVVVVDMDFQLGEIALDLGMTPSFSVVDALVNPGRLDKHFLDTLLLRHSSGLAILSAPEQYNFFPTPVDGGADKLFDILRKEFDYVVVDMGTCYGDIQEKVFGLADALYLITEMSFPSMRNAHRLISFLSARDESRALQVVLNRFNSRQTTIDENACTKVLGRPINWNVPNAWAAARAAQDSGVPLAMKDSPITRVLVQMARAASGKPLLPDKKTSEGFSFFRMRTAESN
ncbi:MAG: AAA family ATPase [Acidobacteriota bacterium]|nr:AAA family ATPase [Acidobacteriota bacterium]